MACTNNIIYLLQPVFAQVDATPHLVAALELTLTWRRAKQNSSRPRINATWNNIHNRQGARQQNLQVRRHNVRL